MNLGWCSTAEAAVRLEVTRPTIISWLRAGTLRGRRVSLGQRLQWQVEIESIEDLLKTRGGPGARRGRPSGSLAAIEPILRELESRIAALENAAVAGGRLAETVGELIDLLSADEVDAADRSRRLVKAQTRLAMSLRANQR
jgi:excisionase family DNA binding protein